MKNTINSFAALETIWNIKRVKEKNEKPRKCHICGSEMEHIVGSNVYVCHGMKTVTDETGVTKEVPCANFVLAQS